MTVSKMKVLPLGWRRFMTEPRHHTAPHRRRIRNQNDEVDSIHIFVAKIQCGA